MKLSVTMLSFTDYIRKGQMSVKDFIELAADYEIEAVDLLEYYWRDKDTEIKMVPQWLRDANLKLGAFCIGNNFLVDIEERRKQIEMVRNGIETAYRLGVNKLRVFGGHLNNLKEEERQKWLDVIIDTFVQCIDYAKENGVILALENHNDIPIKIEEVEKILKALNSEYFMMNFDIGNFYLSAGEDPIEAVDRLYDYIVHCHVKDAVYSRREGRKYDFCVVGEGIVPVKQTFAKLKQKGYDGYISLEYEGWDTFDSKLGVEKSIAYLKNVIKEL